MTLATSCDVQVEALLAGLAFLDGGSGHSGSASDLILDVLLIRAGEFFPAACRGVTAVVACLTVIRGMLALSTPRDAAVSV